MRLRRRQIARALLLRRTTASVQSRLLRLFTRTGWGVWQSGVNNGLTGTGTVRLKYWIPSILLWLMGNEWLVVMIIVYVVVRPRLLDIMKLNT